MNYEELQQHIRYLESLEDVGSPIVNCYLGLESFYRKTLNEQSRSITAGLPVEMRASFWEILGYIEVFLGTNIAPGTKGAACFARWGEQSFFLPLQFEVTFPNSLVIRPMPQIYPLIQLRNEMVSLIANPNEMANFNRLGFWK
jgi:hypothetical protein